MKNIKALVLCFFFYLAAAQGFCQFGNWFTANKRLATVLDNSDKKISYRFTCREDMTLTAAAVFCVDAQKAPAYLLSLEEDDKGFPSGSPISSFSFVPRSQSWSTIPLDSASLTQGKVYHLVLEQDVRRGGGHPVGSIDAFHFASFLSTDVLNHLVPKDGSPDLHTNTLVMEKDKWKELDQEPVYVIYASGSKSQGNPYDDPGLCPIYGNPGDKNQQVLQGQTLHFHCGFTAKSFALRVKKQGDPQSPLNYQILKSDYKNHKNYPVDTAVALRPDQVSSEFKWVTVGFDDRGFSNFSPECWYLVFQTDSGRASSNSPGCEDCYILSDVGNSGGLADAAHLTFDGGPHLSREVYSTSSGSPPDWVDQFERDANVGALGTTCPAMQVLEIKPIPTPRPVDQWEGMNP